MFRTLIRLGVIALFVLSLSAPAQAMPLAEAGGFTGALSEIWSRLTAPLAGLWEATRGTCDPNGGLCPSDPAKPAETFETRGTCDPNGGVCGEGTDA